MTSSNGFIGTRRGGGTVGKGSSGIVMHSEGTFCKAESDLTLRNAFGFSPLLLVLLIQLEPGIGSRLVVGTKGRLFLFETDGELVSVTDGVRFGERLFDVTAVTGEGTGEVVGLIKITSSSCADVEGSGRGWGGLGGNLIFLIPRKRLSISKILVLLPTCLFYFI